jgi:uncharacterized protein YndB with AHSA1/START domain
MNSFGRVTDGNTIRFERTLPCSLETAWSYLTQPGRLATWLAEGTIELRVGGRVDLSFDVEEVPEHMPGGAFILGAVTLCVPQRVLAFTWTNPDTTTDSDRAIPTVSFELEPHDQYVRLSLTHRHLTSDAVARYAAGWHTHLDILLARLQNHQPDAFLSTWKRLLPVYEEQASALQ